MPKHLRYALRSLARNRGFTFLAVATLALGIGSCTSIFSVVEGILLAPLPYPDSSRIVSLVTRWQDTGRLSPRVSGGDFVNLREDTRSFEAVSLYWGGELGVQMRDSAEFAGVFLVNPAFFRVFGTVPVAGSIFTDSQPGRAAVVSAAFAQRNFGSPQRAVGQTLRVENAAYEITAVVPASLRFPAKTDVWLRSPYTPENLNRTAFNYRAVAKLRPGVPLHQAQAGLDLLAANLQKLEPASNRNKTFNAIPLRDQLAGPVRTTLWFLLASVALLLLIACANVSNLLLARAAARSREIAVRVAMGASRAQLLRQLFIESLVLAALGGLFGVVLAYSLTRLLPALAPAGLLRLEAVHVNVPVLAFAFLVSAASSLLFGLGPAWHATRVDLNTALKQGSGKGLPGTGSHRFRQALAITQIALAVILAMGAGLMGRSLAALGETALGFAPDRLLVMYAHAPAATENEYVAVTRLFAGLLPELQSLPGVRSAAAAMGLPAGRYGSNGMYAVEGRHEFRPGEQLPEAGFRLASPGYFSTLGVPLLRGREFAPGDLFESQPVVIVSQALARETFPGDDPLGRRIKCGLDRDVWMTVVGVVGDVRPSPAEAPGPELYMPLAQHPVMANEVQVVLRAGLQPESLTGAVREVVRRRNPSIAVSFTTMDRMLAESTSAPRFRTWLAGAFASLALLLAMAGIYGVIAFLVAQRTAEVGLRMALGARPADIGRLVVGQAARLIMLGLAAGIAVSLAAGSLIRSLLYQVQPLDAWTYAIVSLLVAGAVLAAAAGPAVRAARISPIEALRVQ